MSSYLEYAVLSSILLVCGFVHIDIFGMNKYNAWSMILSFSGIIAFSIIYTFYGDEKQ